MALKQLSDDINKNKKFEGWYTDQQCTKKADFSKPITRDTKYYSKWSEKSFITTFDVDGAFSGADSLVSEVIEDGGRARNICFSLTEEIPVPQIGSGVVDKIPYELAQFTCSDIKWTSNDPDFVGLIKETFKYTAKFTLTARYDESFNIIESVRDVFYHTKALSCNTIYFTKAGVQSTNIHDVNSAQIEIVFQL